MSNESQSNKIFWLLTMAIFSILLLPNLVQHGMFLDGVTYAAISKNLANGYGSFFSPHYTKTLYPVFNEHPPLVFIIQSYFFKLLGELYFTEKIFSLIMCLLSIFGILKCWKLFERGSWLNSYDWLPVFLWLSVPLVSWSYKNNLLDNVLAVFTIFAVFFILKSLLSRKLIYLTIGSIFVNLSFLTKGLVGLFPLAVPIIFVLIYGLKRKLLLYNLYLVLFCIIFLGTLLYLLPELKFNIENYLHQQVVPSLKGTREITTHNRLNIVFKLILELLIPIILAVIVLILGKKGGYFLEAFRDKKFLTFLFIGFISSLPLIISVKQRKFYLIPSISFYALSLAYLMTPSLRNFSDRLSRNILKGIKGLALVIISITLSLSILKIREYSRDKEKLADVHIISNILSEGTIIGTTQNLWEDWGLVAYLSRVGYLSLDTNAKHQYFLSHKDNIDQVILQEYENMDVQLRQFVLLKRKGQ